MLQYKELGKGVCESCIMQIIKLYYLRKME